MMGEEQKLVEDFYRDEITDREFYKKLAKRSKNKNLRDKLDYLAEMEESHSTFWKDRLNKAYGKGADLKPRGFKIFMLLFLTKFLGNNLTVNLLERGEVESIRKYRDFLKRIKDDDESKALNSIIEDEISHENVFEEMGIDKDAYLDRIQAFIYGMSDGLVEVLAAIAGLTAIISNNFIIAMSGLVIGVGGTISMTLGAYLSKSSEIEYRIRNIKRESLITNVSTKKMKKDIENEENRTKVSAGTTGLSYIAGAAFPIIPFLFPIGIFSLIIAVALVAIVQAVSNSIIAIALNISILKSSSRAALLSLLAAAITYSIGFIFHTYFHIYIG
ncbi:MAG: VIT1/CCC1 family protein [Candidatus Thermoplasmatota archaeon]|nr:VIT1/CCC1 family protein [Candidatus Thermoplasmatota archaeon]MCL5889063.1 VIT1/CCC1 family protein [Candidatus Thermoplasmatota archaeon]